MEKQRIKDLFALMLNARSFEFPKIGGIKNVSTSPGVYIIFNPNGEVCHVGVVTTGTFGLLGRLNDHVYFRSSFARHFLRPNGYSVRDDYTFKYIEVENLRERLLLEALATGELCPIYVPNYGT